MTTAEVEALNTEVEFVYYKAYTFTEDYVDEVILPAVKDRLDEIRQVLDKLVLNWLKFKSQNKGKPCIQELERSVTEVTEAVLNSLSIQSIHSIPAINSMHSMLSISLLNNQFLLAFL